MDRASIEIFPLTVLYAEDDETVNDLIGKRLRRVVRDVHVAEDGQRAWELFQEIRPDILVTDLTMPKMSGLELIANIRSITPDLPIIVTTAHSDSQYISQLFDLHINHFLLKPYNFGKLHEKIKEVYDTFQVAQERDEYANLLVEYKKVIDENNIVSKTDTTGRITYVNDLFCEETGYTKDEVIGKAHNIVRHPETPKEFYSELWETIQQKHTWHGILKNRRKDGTPYIGDVSISPILDTRGDIIEYISIRRDISDIIEAQNKITEERTTIELLLNMQESMVVFGIKGEGLLKANQTFFDFLGLRNLQEFKAKYNSMRNVFVREEGYVHDFPYIHWSDYVIENTSDDHKAKLIDKDGKAHIFSIECKNGLLEGKPFYIATLSNITVFEEARSKAVEADRLKSIFLANMSHEIRTPMNAILGFVEILKSTPLNHQQSEYVSTIHSSADALLRVINDILDFSKIENNSLEIETIKFNILEEIEGMIELFGVKAEEKEITLLIDIDSELPEILYGDPLRIKQILSNLLSNAIKFTPSGKNVTLFIHLHECQDKVCHMSFGVKDEGIGIPQDKIDAIFNPFTQTDASISRQYGGTGLGLSISKKLAGLMNGKLNVESELGMGSRFYVTLNITSEHGVPNHQLRQEISHYLQTKQIAFLIPSLRHTVYESIVTQWFSKISNQNIKSQRPLEVTPQGLDILLAIYEKERHDTYLSFSAKNPHLTLIIVAQHKDYENLKDLTHSDHIKFIFTPLYTQKILHRLESIIKNQCNSTSEESTSVEPLDFSHVSLLVAEDDATNQRLISLILTKAGFSPVIVSNGKEALEHMEKEPFDIVLMDINMPIMDGITAMQQWRSREAITQTHLPIIALTANAIKGDRENFLNLGFTDYLSKPIQIDRLNEVLHHYVAKGKHLIPTQSTSLEPKLINQESDDNWIQDSLASASKELGLPEDLISELFHEMISNIAPDIITLRQEVDNKNLVGIYQAAHKIKGVFGNMRFKEVQQLAFDLEKEAKGENNEFDYNHSCQIIEEKFRALTEFDKEHA